MGTAALSIAPTTAVEKGIKSAGITLTLDLTGETFIGTGSLVAPTYFGTTVVPDTGGSLYSNSATPTAVTPPADMVAGDLVVLFSAIESNSDSAAISNTGGQTWNAVGGTVQYSTVARSQAWWCRFDGTWDANPSISHTANTAGLTQGMQVFRPGSGSYTWDLDIAAVGNTYAAPGSPFDVTLSGVTTLTDQAVVLAYWYSYGAVTDWTLQTGGWANAGSDEYTNYASGDQSHSWAYLIKTSAGGTGDVTNRQATGGGKPGIYRLLVFKQVAP